MINPINFRLGLHYHSPYFINNNGEVYIKTVAGMWIDELSNYWKEIFYIGHQTSIQLESQDYCIKNSNKNIKLFSCGEPGNVITLPKRALKTYFSVKRISKFMDGILIMGPTPRQGNVYSAFKKENRALYLVGEPPETPLLKCIRKQGLKGIFFEYLIRRRKKQNLKLAKKTIMLANSMELCQKYSSLTNKEVFFCPYSTLKEESLYFLQDRCLNETINLLFVGRVEKAKGIVELIKALPIIKSKGIKIKLNVIGPFSENYTLRELKKFCKDNNLEDLVIWHGFVNHNKELYEFYKKSDILILPSYYEGFPYVVLEAMASSVLVLSTAVGGIPYICKDREEIYFISHDPGNIASAVEILTKDSQLRQKMIKKGLSFAKKMVLAENMKLMTEILKNNFM